MKNIHSILKNVNRPKRLAVIFPHPDDETMATGGLLLTAKHAGWKTTVITLTRGEAGKAYINLRGKSLKETRIEELRRATRLLGVNNLILGNFSDGNLRKQRSKWGPWLQIQIEKHRPSVVITYDHTGLTGHPDHIILSIALKQILTKSSTRLFWESLPSELKSRYVPEPLRNHVSPPTHILNLNWRWTIQKWKAIRAHKSQNLGKDLPIPLGLILAKYHYEWYHEVDKSKEYPHKFIKFNI